MFILRFIAIIKLLILVNVNQYLADVLNANIQILDQLSNTGSSSLKYYWASSSNNLARNLNVQISLSTSLGPISTLLLLPSAVTIVCQQSAETATDTSYIKTLFTSTPITTLTNSTVLNIPFTIINGGKPAPIICTGSVDNFTPQIYNGVQLTSLKINPSLRRQLKIASYPTISFNQNQELTSSLVISPYQTSSFQLFLRDTVYFQNTAITCSISPTNGYLTLNSGTGQSGLFTSTYGVGVGSSLAKLSYTVSYQNGLLLNQVYTLNCNAQSSTSNINLLQYQGALTTATATISFIQPQINFLADFNAIFYGSNFLIPLKLNPQNPSGTKVSIQCNIRRFATLSDLKTFQSTIKPNNSPQDFPYPVVKPMFDPTTYTNNSFDWYFTNSSGNFFNMEYQVESQQINIAIYRIPFDPIRESVTVYLSLFCSDVTPAPNALYKYSNAIAALVLKISPNSNPKIIANFTGPTDNQLLDPSFDPCTCDLTIEICDQNCCCDPDCTSDDLNALNLVCPLKYRSVFEKTVDQWTCKDIYNNPKFDQPDYFPILCIQSNTTVILGKFYTPKALADFVARPDFPAQVNNLVKSSYNTRSRYLNDPLYSSQQIDQSLFCNLDQNDAYIYGSCVKTAAFMTDTNANDFFRFPQAIGSFSSCLYDAPVKFLEKDTRSFCRNNINIQACTSNVNYDIKKFNQKIIFKNPINPSDKINIADESIEYYKCTNPFSGSTITTQTNSNLFCQISSTSPCNFNVNTKLFDLDLTDIDCSNDTWIYSGTRNKNIANQVKSDYYLRPDLTSNNCQTISNPTSPQINGNICTNTVASVKYVIFWNGQNISKIITRIILTDIPLSSTITPIQMFEIKWNYLPNTTYDTLNFNSVISMSDYDNLITSESYINSLKSGIKGYFIGKPVISGYKNPSNQIDITDGQRISTFKILNGKLCGTLSKLERSQLLFGQNTSSSCIVQVDKNDIAYFSNSNNVFTQPNTCLCLRRILFNKLNDYFVPSNIVSKNGNPNMTSFNTADWLNVYPTNRVLANQSTSNPNISNIYTCLDVPSKITMWFFYADAGKLNGTSFYEIVGTYVSYSYTDFNFICAGSDRKGCENNINTAQDFEITFQSNFIEVSNPNRNMSWLDHCSSDKYPSQFCLQEVFWTWPKDPNDPNFFYLYGVQLSLLFGIFSLIVFYLMIFGFICPC